jgi:1,4-dihydroxy-6-naphthoate synthase
MNTIHVAHSPDSDDAFMFYALATGKIETDGIEFVHHLDDIESLNQAALSGKYEVTAVSIHAYAYLADRYALLYSGASMGEGYGPVLVARESFSSDCLEKKVVAVPGEKTSALLALRLCSPGITTRVVRFDEIIPAVIDGKVDAGLVIHEGQLFYGRQGLRKILDLGEWWQNETGLPLPLGGNVVRRDLGSEQVHRIAGLIKESIGYALEHREEALEYALDFGRGLTSEEGDRFVGMYVNDRTLDYGPKGREAVQMFLDRGFEAGIIPRQVQADFI